VSPSLPNTTAEALGVAAAEVEEAADVDVVAEVLLASVDVVLGVAEELVVVLWAFVVVG
jgi:hypothetical protein